MKKIYLNPAELTTKPRSKEDLWKKLPLKLE